MGEGDELERVGLIEKEGKALTSPLRTDDLDAFSLSAGVSNIPDTSFLSLLNRPITNPLNPESTNVKAALQRGSERDITAEMHYVYEDDARGCLFLCCIDSRQDVHLSFLQLEQTRLFEDDIGRGTGGHMHSRETKCKRSWWQGSS